MKCLWIDTFTTSYTENSSYLYGRDAVLMTHILWCKRYKSTTVGRSQNKDVEQSISSGTCDLTNQLNDKIKWTNKSPSHLTRRPLARRYWAQSGTTIKSIEWKKRRKPKRNCEHKIYVVKWYEFMKWELKVLKLDFPKIPSTRNSNKLFFCTEKYDMLI